MRIVNTPPTFTRTVALTFDDGPNPTYTAEVLAVLRKHHVHGTFFMVGRRVALYPAVFKQVADDGNVIGNHTWDHPAVGVGFDGLTKAEVAAEIDRTTALIQGLNGAAVCFFRAPQGKDLKPAVQQVTQARRLTVAKMHSAFDYKQPHRVDPAWVRPITGRLVAQGDHRILLLHDGGTSRQNSVLALDRIITWYQQRGYVFTDPAGRPFPGELPPGTHPPRTGWAIDPAAAAAGTRTTGAAGSAIGTAIAADGQPVQPDPASAQPGVEPGDGASQPAPHREGTAVGTRPADGKSVPI